METTPHSGSDLSSYVKQARAGDRAAMAYLIEFYYQRVFNLALHRTLGRQDAEDLTQDIFIKMIRSLPRLRQDDRFAPWLYRIALNRINDFYRKKRLLSFFTNTPEERRAEAAAASGEEPEKARDLFELHQAVEKALRKLPRTEQDIFRLKYLDELTISEIAETLKKNESTVKTHLYRAVKKIRKNPSLQKMFSGVRS